MDTMDTMARDPQTLRLTMDMDMVMAMDTVMVDMDMDTTDTMARDPLMPRLLLLLSQVMDTMDMVTAMDMVMVDMDMVMDMDIMDTTARDLLMLSQATDTMDMVMDMAMDMVMDMAMAMDTTDKYLSFLLCSLEFSTNEIEPSFGTSHFQTIQKPSINYFLSNSTFLQFLHNIGRDKLGDNCIISLHLQILLLN